MSCSDQADKNSGRSQETDRVLVAVASNFVATLAELEPVFEATSGFQLDMSSGSTGKLYAQIVAGAPYDIFLSADVQRPAKLFETELVARRFKYAEGRLVLWSVDSIDAKATTLKERLADTGLHHLAIANPALAPYGAAAEEVLTALGLLEALRLRLVFGENIGQAHALVTTGNAELGVTAQSYLHTYLAANSPGAAQRVQTWPIPSHLHSPIVQEGVWLRRAAANQAAAAFVEFMQSRAARDVIRAAGYEIPL